MNSWIHDPDVDDSYGIAITCRIFLILSILGLDEFMDSWIHDVDFHDSYGILIKCTHLRLEAAMKTEKENMRSTLDSILAKV